MNHREALNRSAVERYLLAELEPAERDEFEEHFFDCTQCTSDLKTTAAFLDGARAEFKRGGFADAPPTAARDTRDARPARFAFLWRRSFAAPAFATLAAVLVYQNLVLYPRMRGELAVLRRPEILTPVSLIGDSSRGGERALGSVGAGDSLLVSVDVPTADQYADYSADLEDPAGERVLSVPVSAAQARDTVTIRVPGRRWERGDYTLVVRGRPRSAAAGALAADASSSGGGGPAVLARYRFTLNARAAP